MPHDNAIKDNTADIAQNMTDIAAITSPIGESRQIASDGIAITLASTSPTLFPGQNSAITFGLGNYDGSNALAMDGSFRLSANTQAFGTVGGTFGSESIGTSLGVQINF